MSYRKEDHYPAPIRTCRGCDREFEAEYWDHRICLECQKEKEGESDDNRLGIDMREYKRGPDHPSWNGGKSHTGGYVKQYLPHHHRANKRYVLEHFLVIEKALGRPFCSPHECHHIDENKKNNAPSNLVACENREYHALLHRRQRALVACGNATWRKCVYCKEYDNPKIMAYDKNGRYYYHRNCHSKYEKERRKKAMNSYKCEDCKEEFSGRDLWVCEDAKLRCSGCTDRMIDKMTEYLEKQAPSAVNAEGCATGQNL